MTAGPAAGWWRWRTRAAARDGWDSPHTAVDVVTDDAPFLVDSVSAALVRRGYDLHLLLHPLLEHPGVGTTSHLHVEIDRETDPVVLAALDLEVRSVVDDVFAAVEDWDAMRERVAELARGLEERPPPHADPADVAEVATYLAWLADDHFTFVAAAEVDVDGDVVPGSELGVARRRALFREHEPADPTDGWLLSLTKSLQHSTVHRDVPLDVVDIRRFGA